MTVKTPPVNIGDICTVEIVDISHKGEGIGKYEGFTVFVPAGVPGDTVSAKIISVKKNYARGLVREVVHSSERRINPSCGVHEECGGCQLQHIAYEHQLELKERIVRQTLCRVGNLDDVTVKPILGMKSPWHYRNKAQFPVGEENGVLIAGCYKLRTHEIVNVNSCAIQQQLINYTLQAVRKACDQWGVEPYDEVNHTGVLRHIVVRDALAARQAMVVLVTRVEDFPGKSGLAKYIADELPEVVSVMQNINPNKTNRILGKKTVCLYGQDHIVDRLMGNSFKISAESFFQVNSRQTEVLYQKVLEYAELTGEENVVDAYCGIGSITLALARNARHAFGVEIVPQAIEDAKENARLNAIYNIDFILGKSEDVIPRMVKEGKRLDAVVVDPPRKGCEEELLAAIVESAVPRMVYVSCNPSTLARDLSYLAQRGYEVIEVQPVDMFPHTAHVETVCLLTHK